MTATTSGVNNSRIRPVCYEIKMSARLIKMTSNSESLAIIATFKRYFFATTNLYVAGDKPTSSSGGEVTKTKGNQALRKKEGDHEKKPKVAKKEGEQEKNLKVAKKEGEQDKKSAKAQEKASDKKPDSKK